MYLGVQRYCKLSEMQNKRRNFALFYKKSTKSFGSSKKYRTFAPAIRIRLSGCKDFGVWCNGNTADSGPAFPGSSPGTPTEEIAKLLKIERLAIFRFHKIRRTILFCR